MTFYADGAQTVVSLLTEYGQAVTFARASGKEIDPVTGEVDEAGTAESHTVSGVLRLYADSSIDETRIKRSDRELIVDATFTPTQEYTVTVDDEAWQVLSIDSINPAGTPLAYILQVRR